jgi:trehalose 2-sulfotransferase
MAEIRRSYVVCSTQRSGSTLLCDLLASTGVAGDPKEFFEAVALTGVPPWPGDYLIGVPRTGAGVRDDRTPAEAPDYSDLRGLEDYREHLSRTYRLGSTPNGVFGAKLMWNQLAEVEVLANRVPEHRGLRGRALIDALLGRPEYVWMRRRDHVRQAVSLWRALQTRTGRSGPAAGGRGPAAPEPVYSYEAIDGLVHFLDDGDDQWHAFFSDNRIAPLTIVYEDDLEGDRRAAVERVLDRIGVTAPAGWEPAERLARQSDELNAEWATRYREAAAAGARGANL